MKNKKIVMLGLMGALMMFGNSMVGSKAFAVDKATTTTPVATTTTVSGTTNATENTNNTTKKAIKKQNKQLNLIGEKKATKIAMDNCKNGRLRKVDLERRKGRLIYEIDILEGKIEREFKIDALTGEILKRDHEKDHLKINQEPKISFEEAMKIANKKAKNPEFKSIELKEKRGKLIYEIEIQDGNREKEFKIDAQTGKILMYKVENDRW